MAAMPEEYRDAVTVEGDDEARVKVRAFLENILKSLELEGDVELQLWNVGHGAEDAVFTTEWDPSEDIREVVDELVDQAVEDAMSIGRGSVKFKVVVAKMKKAGRVVFTLKVPVTVALDDIEDIEEVPTRKGLLSQLMRHLEVQTKAGAGTTVKTNDMLLRMIKQRDERIAELEGRYLEQAKTYEELLSGRHVRDLELRKIEADERRKEQVAGLVLSGAPLLLNKFLGGPPSTGGAPPQGFPFPGFPGAPGFPGTEASAPSAPHSPHYAHADVTPLEHLIEGLLNSLSQEQFQRIVQSGVFTPMQIANLVEIVKVIQQKQEHRTAAAAAAARQSPPVSAG